MLKRVFTRVDFPRPDSPEERISCGAFAMGQPPALTNYHNVEVKTLSHTLAMPLVWQVGESDVPSQLPADDISVVVDSSRN